MTLRSAVLSLVVSTLLATTLAFGQRATVGGKTLDEWVELTQTQDPIQHATVNALAEFGPPAIPHLIHLLRTAAGGDIRFLAQKGLAEIGQPAVPELRRIFEDGDTSARIGAVLALETILAQRAVPLLLKAAEEEDLAVVVRARGALLRVTGNSEEHLPGLVAGLGSDDQGVRWLAAESLGWCGELAADAVPAVAAALGDPSGSVRDQVIVALERVGTQEAMTALALGRLEELRTGDVPTRLTVATRLGRAGPAVSQAAPVLEALVADPAQDILVRGYAAWALQQIRPATRAPREFHVAQNHPAASDDNPGTESQPWKTIQRAAEALVPGDTVTIHEGIYRECVRPFVGGTDSDHTITYRAAAGEQVVITGSDVWEPGWKEVEVGNPPLTVWQAAYERHPWDRPEEWPEPNEGPQHRAEQVFVDGRLLTHVATVEELAETPRTFVTGDEAGMMLVRLPDDGPPDEHFIERSVRQQILAPVVRGLGHIRVQGLTMRCAANPESNGSNWGQIGHRAAFSTRAGHHWIIEDNTITWANAQGMDVGGEGWSADLRQQPVVSDEIGHHQLRRNEVSHNGVAGIVGWSGGVNSLLLEDNVTNFNCLKRNFYAYEAAGIKFHQAKDTIVRRHRSHGNEAFGIWFDHQCERNRISQSILTDNVGAGIFFEVSAGPMLIDTNVIIGTRHAANGGWAEGLYSHDGNHATYANNLILNCDHFGVRLRNLFGRIADGKPTTTSHNRVYNNIIAGNAAGAVSLNPSVELAEDNLSDHNILCGESDPPPVMRLEAGGDIIKWEQTPIGENLGLSGSGSQVLTLDQWRQFTQNDRESIVVPFEKLGLQIPETVGPTTDLTSLLDLMKRSSPTDRIGLDDGYAEYAPRPARAIAAGLGLALDQ